MHTAGPAVVLRTCVCSVISNAPLPVGVAYQLLYLPIQGGASRSMDQHTDAVVRLYHSNNVLDI